MAVSCPSCLCAFARPPGAMVTTCKWIPCASTDSAEIPGVYESACLPTNSAPGRTTRQVGIVPSRLAVSVLVSIVINGVRLSGVRNNKTIDTSTETANRLRSEEHTSELQSHSDLV